MCCKTIQGFLHEETQVFTTTYFLFCLLQGDPGGVIGIVPLKGDRGFPGAPGLPVRLCMCVCS